MRSIDQAHAASRRDVAAVRALLVLVVTTLLAAFAAGSAAATGADRVHVDEAIAGEVDVDALERAVADARGDGVDLQVVVLAGEPDGGAQAEADRRVDAQSGAALVITPQEVGAVSDDHSDTQVDRALDDALDVLDDDGEDAAAAAFAAGLQRDGLPFELGTGMIVLIVSAVLLLSIVPRLLGFGGRRSRYGRNRYGRRRGGLGAAAMGAALGSRSRSGGSRSRGGGGRSRGGGSRRR